MVTAVMLAFGESSIILTLVLLLASAAAILSQKKPKVASLDDALSSTATQGAFVPLVIGRQRVGCIFAFVQDHVSPFAFTSSPSGGGRNGVFGKGRGGAPQQPSYLEDALHLVCVGPAIELRTIYQNGEAIWRGPISPQTHPSGSSITIPNEGTFEVHWGFPDDPPLTLLANNTKAHGLLVRYSHVMKILWTPKSLGQSRQWPRIEYEIVCPCYSQIGQSSPELPLEGKDQKPTWSEMLGYTKYTRNSDRTSGPYTASDRVQCLIVGYDPTAREILVVDPKAGEPNATPHADVWDSIFQVGGIVKVWTFDNTHWGNQYGATPPLGAPCVPTTTYAPYAHPLGSLQPNGVWKYYWVLGYRRIPIVTVADIGLPTGVIGDALALRLGTEVSPISLVDLNPAAPFDYRYLGAPIGNGPLMPNGAVWPVSTADSDGINPIHMVDQMLFAKYPYGAGKDRSEFSVESIESSALIVEREKIRGSALVADGEGLESVLAPLMQDLGLMIPFDPATGKNVFRLVRYTETPIEIPAEMVLSPVTMEAPQGDRVLDVIAFTYNDRNRNYREVPVKVMDGGQIADYESQRSQKVRVEVTSDRDSINRIIPRRQQEVLANQASFTFDLNHAAVTIVPGTSFRVPSIEGVEIQFVATEIERDINSAKTVVSALLDIYNPPTPAAGQAGAGLLDDLPSSGEAEEALQPAYAEAFELPVLLASGTKNVEMLVLCAPANGAVVSAVVWASRDGTSFETAGYGVVAACGQLEEALPVDGASYEDGLSCLFSWVGGSSAAMVEDLSGDQNSWRAGRQVMLIGGELIFLRSTQLSHLEGLIRGRAGTKQRTHAVGTRFWIFRASNAVPISFDGFVIDQDVHYKLQAVTLRGSSDVALAPDQTVSVEGSAFTPIAPAGLRQASLLPSYAAAGNLTLVWGYSSTVFPRTALGTQPAGAKIASSPPRGVFTIDLMNGTTVVRTFQTTVPTITLTPSNRTGLDGLSSWTARVTHTEGAFTSKAATLTLSPY